LCVVTNVVEEGDNEGLPAPQSCAVKTVSLYSIISDTTVTRTGKLRAQKHEGLLQEQVVMDGFYTNAIGQTVEELHTAKKAHAAKNVSTCNYRKCKLFLLERCVCG
jgi:hypothetical protein